MKALHSISFILVIIGGLNWLLVGINPGWDLVQLILGSIPVLARIVYILVGLSAIVMLATHKSSCKNCDSSATPTV